MGTLIQDLHYSLRILRKSPGFTAVAVFTLALGIGATTAIFTLVQQVMLRSLPVVRPDQLWRVGDAVRCCYSNGYMQGDGSFLPPNDWSFFSWEAYKLFRADTPEFEDLAAFQIGEANAQLGVRRAGPCRDGQRRVRLRQFLQDVRHFRLAWASVHRCRRPGRHTAGGGDQFPRVARKVRVRSVGGRSDVRDQRPSVHDDRCRPAELLRSEGRRLGYAGFLAAAHDGAADRRRNFAT